MNVTFTFNCNECGVSVSAKGRWDSEFVQYIEENFNETHDNHKRGI